MTTMPDRSLVVAMEQLNTEIDEWMGSLASLADGRTKFSMAEKISRVTLDIIAKVVTSVLYHHGCKLKIEAMQNNSTLS